MPAFLFDTNVVSELRRVQPHQGVVKWMATLAVDEIFISAVTFGEIQRGVEATRRTDSQKALEIENWMDAVVASFPFIAMDREMFRECARLMHRRSSADLEDAMVAAAARVRGLTIATRNTADFQSFGVALFNPFSFRG